MANRQIKYEPHIIDNLTSTSTSDALSANQGKVLDEKINNILQALRPATKLSLSSNYTLFNCTGTLSLVPDVYVNADKSVIWIFGRVRITNFVRTGPNPGVAFRTGQTFSRTVSSFPAGTCFDSNGKIVPEIVNVNVSPDGIIGISATETTRNVSNGEYCCLFYGSPIVF